MYLYAQFNFKKLSSFYHPLYFITFITKYLNNESVQGREMTQETDWIQWSGFIVKVCLIGRSMSATVWFKETPFGRSSVPATAGHSWDGSYKPGGLRHRRLAGCFCLVTGTWERNARWEGLIYYSPSEGSRLSPWSPAFMFPGLE